MSTTPQESAVIDYLMRTRGLDREVASNLLHGGGLHLNWFANAEPELRESLQADRGLPVETHMD